MRTPTRGSRSSKRLPRAALCLLDKGLSWRIAEALNLVSYRFTSVREEFGPRSSGPDDREIIEWCTQNKAAWFTLDDDAKREHEALLRAGHVPVVWIRQPGVGLSEREQFTRIVGGEVAREIVAAFLSARFIPEEKYVRRLNKIKALDTR